MTEADNLVGEKVMWLEDGTFATITKCIDKDTGIYEFKSLDDGDVWAGFDDEFVLAD